MTGDQSTEEKGGQSLPVRAQIESLLFVANEPVDIEQLAKVLQISSDEVEAELRNLHEEYDQRGFRLQRRGQRVQMVTAPESASQVRRFLGLELSGKLSPAALETLAIAAYRQPVTRAQIEAIRGVNSDSVLRTLVNHGLIEEQGRLEQAGRPIIFGTTFEFLQQFGLSDINQLPSLQSIEHSE